MLKEVLSKTKQNLESAVDFYHKEVGTVRTGRATPSLVEDIQVDFYGQKMHIKELASITTPEPRTLMIQPWDANAIEAIRGAISKSDLGLNPAVDGQTIRLNIPPLTEERRKEFVKVLKNKTEETRIKIRRIREDAWNEIQKLEKNKEIGEDEKFKSKEDLQELVDSYNKKIEEMEKKKEDELMKT
ncbi:MAG: ribosome recycling factor [Candidatus Yanofskybacteria bacterium CG10_big_fil_rev_8_21_14_0_10_36_16]|uniref:Ribosome-recycling factor n=1 Tax=Candidatus Yanofskybacteria bacterium CG10_big_fil_rev_8_21_14_0_10_36_16 TaxID=1975096 RepID=A0A2J0QC39_9BACT|nr:MAG: ribosome recycling factor [Candidatus Yanofskybacteria bacterium CG10_big_fil_rev_8_21_14_0_10_36_16]